MTDEIQDPVELRRRWLVARADVKRGEEQIEHLKGQLREKQAELASTRAALAACEELADRAVELTRKLREARAEIRAMARRKTAAKRAR